MTRLDERQPHNLFRRCDDRLVVTPPRPDTDRTDIRFFKGCKACHRRSPSMLPSPLSWIDRTICWQTLGQTCSRGDPGSAICVQRLDDSLNSAIHTRYRSLLRSSSMHEPRDPPSEVVKFSNQRTIPKTTQGFKEVTQKTKDGRTQFEARQAVHIDSHRFKCVTRFNAGSTPPMNRAETLPSPVAGARCFTIAARSNNG